MATPEMIRKLIDHKMVECDMCGETVNVNDSHAPRDYKHVCPKCYHKLGW